MKIIILCQNYNYIKNIFLESAGLLDIIDFVRSITLADQDTSANEDIKNPYQEAHKYYDEKTKEYGWKKEKKKESKMRFCMG